MGLAAEHVAEFRDLVVDLIQTHADEIGEHDLGHGPQARERGAGGGPDDRGLGDGGIENPALAESRQQPLGDAEYSARCLALPDEPPAPPDTSSPSTITRSSRAISWWRA